MSQPLITRRTVLRAGALSAVAAAIPVGAIELLAGNLVPLNTWSMAQFQRLVGSTFVTGEHRVPLTLAGVRNTLTASRASASHECFALTFTGPSSATGLGDTQVVRHAKLGLFAMFLSDGGRTADAQTYVAIVNRI